MKIIEPQKEKLPENINNAILSADFMDTLTWYEVKGILFGARHTFIEMLDLAFEHGKIDQRMREIAYDRHINWMTLEEVGKKHNITRERVRQIDAKTDEVLRCLTKKV